MKSKYRKKYLEYLKSDKWQEVRKAKAKEQNYTCERCHKVIKKGFHIHHKTYEHLGNEPLSDLMFLCEDCHKEIHKIIAKKKMRKSKTSPKNKNKRKTVRKPSKKPSVAKKRFSR